MFFLNRLRQSRRSAEASERRKLRERGAAALEFALVAPFFFLVVFSGIEIGMMFRSHLALEDMSRGAARIASVQRNDPGADTAILTHINNRASVLNGDITKVIIFAAPTLNAELPVDCDVATASRANQCNVYIVDGRGVQGVLDDGANEAGLTATERAAWQNLGIYVEYDYQYVTGFFDSITLSTTSVEVVELDL